MQQTSRAHLTTAAMLVVILGAAVSTGVQASNTERRLIKLAAGEQAQIAGASYQSGPQSIALVSTSSELVTVAVITGELTQGVSRAHAGQALVTPIDSQTAQRFGFDAAKLAATLPPQWASDTAMPLARLAVQQKRARFWGLIEPAGINASAPAGPQVEAVRLSYLGNETILALRREAQGKPDALASLTIKRFVEALAAGDAAVVADLLDPKPFTDTNATAAAWQAARLAFANKLTGDQALKQAMAMPADAPGAYRIELVSRDRAMFVSAVEPKS